MGGFIYTTRFSNQFNSALAYSCLSSHHSQTIHIWKLIYGSSISPYFCAGSWSRPRVERSPSFTFALATTSRFSETLHCAPVFSSHSEQCTVISPTMVGLQHALCPGRDSNPHSLRNSILSRARLPITPPGPFISTTGEAS